jgi:hypothetical protein
MIQRLAYLLRNILQPQPQWVLDLNGRRCLGIVAVAIISLALYGFTVGYWRSPLMGVFVAIKMPMLIALTLGCNALLNGFLGMLLQSGLGFRQSLVALLWAFAVAAILLAAISPVTFFLAWNAPSPHAPNAAIAHSSYLLAHTCIIACVGVFSHMHLHRLLAHHAPSRLSAWFTLLSWLTGNAVLGAQFSWILRPFFGTPTLDVRFLRDDPFHGTFYETIWHSLQHIMPTPGLIVITASIVILIFALVFQKQLSHINHTNKP